MSRFKILVFILTIGIAGSVIAGAYWYYTRILGHDSTLESEIQALQHKKTAPPDPGIRRFERAIEIVKEGDLKEGRKALYELLHTFPNSTKADEAKRIIGEMNMDMMFSVNDNPQRKDYVVQPGDSLGLIARKQQTTIECIMRANNMLSPRLQPGDHLFVFPLDFSVQVNLADKTLTLLRGESFFKEYEVLDVRLPNNVRAPAELTLNDKAAWVGGKRVLSTDNQFVSADKWLMGNRPGVNIRSTPQAKPLPQEPAADKKKDKNATNAPEIAPAPETGVFLKREDIEELYTIIKTGTPLGLKR